MPPLSERIKNYLEEKKIWEKAGKPLRSQQEISKIYNKYCSECQFLTKDRLGNTQCNICGCFINRGYTINKIAWATTRCPDDPPKWIENINNEKKEQPQTIKSTVELANRENSSSCCGN